MYYMCINDLLKEMCAAHSHCCFVSLQFNFLYIFELVEYIILSYYFIFKVNAIYFLLTHYIAKRLSFMLINNFRLTRFT